MEACLETQVSTGPPQNPIGTANPDSTDGQGVEVFAVEVLSGVRWPGIVGFQQETINGVFIAPR